MDVEQPITCSLGLSARLLTLLGGYSWGPPRGQAAMARVSVLASWRDSLLHIGNI